MFKGSLLNFSKRDIFLCVFVGIINLVVAITCLTFSFQGIVLIGIVNGILAVLNLVTAIVAFSMLDHNTVIAGNLDG